MAKDKVLEKVTSEMGTFEDKMLYFMAKYYIKVLIIMYIILCIIIWLSYSYGKADGSVLLEKNLSCNYVMQKYCGFSFVMI